MGALIVLTADLGFCCRDALLEERSGVLDLELPMTRLIEHAAIMCNGDAGYVRAFRLEAAVFGTGR